MIKNFRHSCIVVKDLNKSLKFYRDTLGLKLSRVRTVKGEYPQTVLGKKGIKLTYAKLRCPGQDRNAPAVFELHYWHRPRIASRSGYNHISFTVKDLDSEYKRLSKLGTKFLSAPTKAPKGRTKICFGYDPDGHLIEFVEDLL